MIAVIGASGRLGASVCRALAASGEDYRPVVREPDRWRALGLSAVPAQADLQDPIGMAQALAGAEQIVSCAHARFTPAVLAAAPAGASFVLMGSTRRFSRWPDEGGDGVRSGEAAFLASGRPGVMLHPTMIYGAAGEDNVQRLAALLRRLPVAPLPGGGRALVQPIHQSDVTRSILAALDRNWPEPEALVIAGPTALPYADFVRAVAKAAGLPPPRIISVPATPLMVLAPLTAFIPKLPNIGADENRRLNEDKAFDVMPMFTKLGLRGIPLAEGLKMTFKNPTPQPEAS